MGTDISQDASQDIINASVNRSHGITMIFTRRRNTGDNDHDIKLNCQSIFFVWGRKATLKNNKIELHKPRFEDVSENDTCFCPTVEVTPMPSFNLTPTMPTIDLCQSCRMVLNECNMKATCRQMRDARWKHCGNIFNWDELSNETEPVCTSECKRYLVAFKKIMGEKISCCNCGEIRDEHEIPVKIRCLQIPKNIDRWCPNTVSTRCSKCPQGLLVQLIKSL